MSRTALAGAAALGAAALLGFVLLRSESGPGVDASHAPATSPADSPDGRGGATPHPRRESLAGTPGPSDPPDASTSDAASTPRVSDGVEGLLAHARAVAAAEAADDEEARDAARERLQAARTDLIELLRRDGAAAHRVLDQLLAADAVDAAALARVLRFVPEGRLGTRLAEAARAAESSHVREAALVALEGRDIALWRAPVLQAFTADPDNAVRDRAAQVLSIALTDPRLMTERDTLRAPLRAGLASTDPEQRRRSIQALALDRDAPDEVRATLRDLAASDPEPSIRRAASMALRAMER
ncbi:MAG: HEAT repeat domain-containing protein [Planctomycetota bacterium]